MELKPEASTSNGLPQSIGKDIYLVFSEGVYDRWLFIVPFLISIVTTILLDRYLTHACHRAWIVCFVRKRPQINRGLT